MAQMVAYHFHGYQPGDIVRLLPGSPLEAPRWEERNSPVALRVGEQRIPGRNWTDCMFSCYDVFMDLFSAMAGELGERICSIDLEPFTLEMLLRKDGREDRNVYGKIMAVFEHRVVDPVATLPFHPMVPYLHPFEQEVLAGVAFDFYGPLMKYLEAGGIWLPEGGYTRQAAATVAAAFTKANGGNAAEPYFVLDGRQFMEPSGSYHLWSLNYIDLGPRRAYAFGRDAQLSDAYSFGGVAIKDLVATIAEDRVDTVKEKQDIPYLITLASDLEALVGGPGQVERFRDLITSLKARGTATLTHTQFLRGKLGGRLKPWEGEGGAPSFRAVVKDFSSWSDYHDQMVGGHTSDTRWQGMRRSDGLVISRVHGRRLISQVWKQGLLAVESAVEAEVRRAFGRVLRAVAREASRDKAMAFLVGYGRTIFREHHLRQGRASGECGPEAAMEHLGSVRDPESLALAARAYYEMLMGLRSDPCFWENLDTRVTFQNVLFLTHALQDVAEALRRVGEAAAADSCLGLLRTHLVGFENTYHLFHLGSLAGYRGWETQEDAWIAALQSEVPRLSAHDCVKRAALFALGDSTGAPLSLLAANPSQVVAATGHIQGEGHGLWEEGAFCEHRTDGGPWPAA